MCLRERGANRRSGLVPSLRSRLSPHLARFTTPQALAGASSAGGWLGGLLKRGFGGQLLSRGLPRDQSLYFIWPLKCWIRCKQHL